MFFLRHFDFKFGLYSPKLAFWEAHSTNERKSFDSNYKVGGMFGISKCLI